jgi:hypothetical protein
MRRPVLGGEIQNDVRWISLDLDSRPSATLNLRYEFRPVLTRLEVFPRCLMMTDLSATACERFQRHGLLSGPTVASGEMPGITFNCGLRIA